MRRRREPGRKVLTRPAIVQAAVAIARRDGVEAVTMRRLAVDLETSPMSLYRHVADRQELLVGMLDVVAENVALPAPVESPRAEVTAVITAIHDALQADHWAVALIVTDKLAGPRIVPAIDRVHAALARAGLSPREVAAAYALLWHYLSGELVNRHHASASDFNRTLVREADEERFPALAAVVAILPDGLPGDYFAENLQRILRGLAIET